MRLQQTLRQQLQLLLLLWLLPMLLPPCVDYASYRSYRRFAAGSQQLCELCRNPAAAVRMI